MKKISYYFKKYWLAYTLAVIALVVYEGLDMVSPQVTKSLIDDVITDGQIDKLMPLLGILAVMGIGRVLFGYFREYTFDKTSFRIASDIRKHLFGHIQGLSVNYFDKTNTGEIMARVKDDVDRIQAAFGYIGMLILQVVVHTGMILYCMFNLSWKLTLFPLVALPVCGTLAIIMEKKLDDVFDKISEENAEMNTVAEENLAGVRTVKAFSREKFEIKKFLGHNRKYYELNMQQSKVWIKYNPVFQLIGRLLSIASIIWGGIMVINGEMSLGTLGAFEEYCANAVWPMEMLGWLSNELAASFASKKKLDKIYAELPVITDCTQLTAEGTADGAEALDSKSITASEAAATVALTDIRGAVEFDNVSLKLGDKQVLQNVSFSLPEGKTLGIMGATGSGKTTVINTLLRFYDVDEGCVRLDGTDIRKLPLEVVRGATSAVMQDVFLFSDTISENVKLGKKDNLSEDEIKQALELSCADFVDKLSDKQETVIGERGVGLSGGQKQRISMARAFAKRSPILVLDDSTSALDTETEKEVQKNLEQMTGMTKIIVTHRVSAVRKADEIIVLEDGKILERGNHEELLAKKGYYYKTWMAQGGEYKLAAGI